jgi:predicted TIM-barrel fold metal-dependent hydrolase
MNTHPIQIERRDFLKSALLTAAVAGIPRADAARANAATTGSGATGGWVDTNVNLFQWPCRRLPLDRTEALVEKLRQHGFAEAWAGSFEGILHRDIGGVNERLTAECERIGGGLLKPFGTINPTLPDWEEDVRRCHEKHGMRGIRLHPNYHGYTLKDPNFARLLALATERNLLVQIAVLMEDTRTHIELMRVADVDVMPLADLMPKNPRARVLLLNSGKVLQKLPEKLAATKGLYYDTARIEGSGEVGRLAKTLPPGSLVFGTHAPFFIFESALIKMDEAGLGLEDVRALLVRNPHALLANV